MSRLGAAALLLLATAGCGGRPATAGAAARPVTVFAAASLTGVFDGLGRSFAAAHPGLVVRFSFGGSGALAQQVLAGAPADVLATADPGPMAQVPAADLAGAARVFATNRLEIAVPPGNPGRVRGLRDLARPGLKVALCAPQVPCGAAARALFRATALAVRPVTLESDVKAVLAKVALGEVDAGVVYRTDVRAAAGQVLGIPVPSTGLPANRYPIAPLRTGPNPSGGALFVEYVLSPAGRRALAAAGFGPPG